MRKSLMMLLSLFCCSLLCAEVSDELVRFFKKVNWNSALTQLKNPRGLELMCMGVVFAFSTFVMFFGLLTNQMYLYSHLLAITAGTVLGSVFAYNEYEQSRYATKAAVYLLAAAAVILFNIICLGLERLISRR